MNNLPSSPDMRWLAGLPHRDRLPLAADELAPREARERIAKVLPGWGLAQFETVASLIASELLTNGLVATRAANWTIPMPPLSLWLCGGPGVLAVLAWDAAEAAPAPRVASDDEESGRGLAIVSALSAASGFYYPEGCPGKIAWAIIDTP